MTAEEFLSIEDAAKLLDVDYKTIYKLVRSGEIPAARIGRVYRIKRADLDEFFERSKAAVQGVECGSCGEFIHSVLGIGARCPGAPTSSTSGSAHKGAGEICGAPLCMRCVKVKEVRRCKEHVG